MSEFNFNPLMNKNGLHQNTPSGFTSALTAPEIRQGILKTYAWMTGGILITTVTAVLAGLFFTSPWMAGMIQALPTLRLISLGVMVVLTIAISALFQKVSTATTRLLFLANAVNTGLLISAGCLYLPLQVVAAAAGISVAFFGCLVFIGFTTKADLTKIGTISGAALGAMIIGTLVMMLLGFSVSQILISSVGLISFAGLTAWDVQHINQKMADFEGNPAEQEKWVIYFATILYLDFINIFLYILRLLSKTSSSK
ncbi:MAG: Bax inhibitor-1/YccA family protein [Erysipelotrichaceae bacterium]|nr:Bax inhibitor-1/YccA family protein [Erysipelotrichaceae bacterium]